MNQPPGRNVWLVAEPGQWWPVVGQADGRLEVQVIRGSITAGSRPGWVWCRAWRYTGAPGPELVAVELLAELLPPDARPL